MKDAAKKLDVVVRRRQEIRVEERKADLVAGAIDDHVGMDLAAVGETHPLILKRCDVRLRRDRAMGDAIEYPSRDGGMRLAELVVGLGQPVALWRTGQRLDRLVDHALANGEGIRGLLGNWSTGLPNTYLGMIQAPLRAARYVLAAT